MVGGVEHVFDACMHHDDDDWSPASPSLFHERVPSRDPCSYEASIGTSQVRAVLLLVFRIGIY